MENQKQQEYLQKIQEAIKKLTGSQKKSCIGLYQQIVTRIEMDKQLNQKEKEILRSKESAFNPLYKLNNDLIEGITPVKQEDLVLKGILTETETKNLNQTLGPHKINEYWMKVLFNNPTVASTITEKDEQALKYIKRIEYSYEGEKKEDLKVVFHFYENPYFTNETLSKTVFVRDDEPQNSEGTEINWKEGKNLTVKVVKKKQKNKNTGERKVTKKEEECESFFNFFKSNSKSEHDHDNDHDDEDEQDHCPEDLLELDYEITTFLVDEGIPYSLEHFLGVVQEDEYDEEGEEDEDDDENEPPRRKKSSKDKKGKKGSTEEKPEKPECKQQ